jgi:hypothetical protein
MAAGVTTKGETQGHARLKRLAFLWAQAQGFSACAMEVSLPRCRFRADVAAYRPLPKKFGWTAIFECKQARPDLRRDNCRSESARKLLDAVCHRRQILEKHLQVHHPNLRINDSLFPEFDSHDFTAIGHRGYARSRSCANRSGRKQRLKIEFTFCNGSRGWDASIQSKVGNHI